MRSRTSKRPHRLPRQPSAWQMGSGISQRSNVAHDAQRLSNMGVFLPNNFVGLANMQIKNSKFTKLLFVIHSY